MRIAVITCALFIICLLIILEKRLNVPQLKFQCIARGSLIFLQYLLNVSIKKQLTSGKSKLSELRQ